jgi:hypothetical protein
MKRRYFILFFLLLYLLSACVAGPSTQPTQPAVEPTVEDTPVVEVENPADLPALPALSGASGLGGGFGGGGGDDTLSVDEMRLWMNPLADAELLLNVGFPTDPVTGQIYQTPAAEIFTQADAADLAALFGINSPVYIYSFELEEGSEFTVPSIYEMFDGTRQLSVGPTYFSYYDQNVGGVDGTVNAMPFAQSGPIAEAFLQEKGLLDFPYQMFSYNGFDVEFRRLIDGRPVIFPEFQVSVNAEGNVWSLFNNPLQQLQVLGDYPLRSAEAAWQLVIEQGVDFSEVFFSSYPGPNYVMPAMPVDTNDYRYWQREYEDGQSVTMYPYPQAFVAVNGDAAPRITVERFLLSGPADQLTAIAEHTNSQIFLTGTIRNTAAGQIIELESWNPVDPAVEYTSREGTVVRNERRTELMVSETESYILPDAPADLLDGERIYVSGWLDGTAGSEPTFNWQGMGILIEEPAGDIVEIAPVDENPYQINQVAFDQIDLVYTAVPVYDDAAAQISYTLQLVWRFRGTADTDEIVEIYVQAVEGTYVSPSPVQ